jgi:hypothetical protein
MSIYEIDTTCGYCQSSPCQCREFNTGPYAERECGYCHMPISECTCDGFGGDPVTHEKPCRYCGGTAIGHICDDCGQAQ